MSDQARVISPGAAAPRPLNEIVRDVLQDVRHIVQAEIRLARTEVGGKVDRAKKAGGVIGAAAVLGMLSTFCLATACVAALAIVMPLWLSALIMGLLLGTGAAVAFTAGRRRLLRIGPVPVQTIQTMEDNVEWVKQRTRQ